MNNLRDAGSPVNHTSQLLSAKTQDIGDPFHLTEYPKDTNETLSSYRTMRETSSSQLHC